MFSKENKLCHKYEVLYVLFSISSIMLLKWKIFSLFWIYQVLLIIFITLKNGGKIKIPKDKWVNFIFGELLIGVVFSVMSDIWLSYRKATIISFILILPIYFTFAYIESLASKDIEVLFVIKKGIKFTCLIELVWWLIQYTLYHGIGFDINTAIFVDILHLTESATHYRADMFLASGLCWHVAFIAPVSIIAFVFFDSYVVKGLAILSAALCNNATAMIGISVCIGLSSFIKVLQLIKENGKLDRKWVLTVVLIAIIVIPVAIHFDIFDLLKDKIIYIYQRATRKIYDGGSADAHIMYYTSYPVVLNKSSIIQIFLGYGSGCSGYPISSIFGQYANLKSWVTESDIMNILISRGILGFFAYYGFLADIIWKGKKIDRRYVIIILCLIICGVTYNIQFDWVFLIELILWISIKYNVNIFRK